MSVDDVDDGASIVWVELLVVHSPPRCAGCGASLADAPVTSTEARQADDRGSVLEIIRLEGDQVVVATNDELTPQQNPRQETTCGPGRSSEAPPYPTPQATP